MKLERGDHVIITQGSYKGYEGVITETHGWDEPDYSVTLESGEEIYVHYGHARRR